MKNMKLIALLFAAPLVAALPNSVSAQEVSASQSAREVLARQIIDTAYPEEQRYAMFAKAGDQMEIQMLQSVQTMITDEGAMDIVRNFQSEVRQTQDVILRKHVPLLMEGWIAAYAEIFSEAELRDILRFVQTDSGKTFMAKSTEVLSNPTFARANQAYMDEAMGAVMAEMPNLVEALSEYKQSETESGD